MLRELQRDKAYESYREVGEESCGEKIKSSGSDL